MAGGDPHVIFLPGGFPLVNDDDDDDDDAPQEDEADGGEEAEGDDAGVAAAAMMQDAPLTLATDDGYGDDDGWGDDEDGGSSFQAEAAASGFYEDIIHQAEMDHFEPPGLVDGGHDNGGGSDTS